jgi:hypothetical protein
MAQVPSLLEHDGLLLQLPVNLTDEHCAFDTGIIGADAEGFPPHIHQKYALLRTYGCMYRSFPQSKVW